MELFPNVTEKLTELQKVSSLLQHHDAITGTIKEKVKYDSENVVTNAIQGLNKLMQLPIKTYLDYKLQEFNLSQFELQFTY